MKTLFTHPQVDPNLYDFLSSTQKSHLEKSPGHCLYTTLSSKQKSIYSFHVSDTKYGRKKVIVVFNDTM